MYPSPTTENLVVNDPEALAMRAFGFIVGNRAALDRLLSLTGRSRADLDREPVDRELLMASLDFLITHEAALIEFSCALDVPLEAAYEARRRFRHSPVRQPTSSQ